MPLRLLVITAALLGTAAQASSLTVYKYTDAAGVVTYSDRAVPGAAVLRLGDEVEERLEERVRLDISRHAAGETLRVHNELYAPVQIELSLEDVDNAVGVPDQPIRWILPPRSHIRLLTLAPRDPARPPSYTPRLRHVLGDPRLLPTQSRYPLPWLGGPFRLTQGPNGRYSHFTPKGRHAVDIAMPVGTPILAARGGVVVSLENRQSGRAGNPSGNFVRILHDDGTMGVYLHLQQGSVRVREGQRIAQGQPIARSGNTGNSTGPHLHFVIQRNIGMALESIPFAFSQPVDRLPNFAMGGE